MCCSIACCHLVPLRVGPAMQIKVISAFAIPHQVHLGQEQQAIVVQAVFGFGS